MKLIDISVQILGTFYVLCGTSSSPSENLFDKYWEFIVSSEPEWATTIGDHRFDNKLNNYTVEHFKECKRKLLEFQDEAKELLRSFESKTTSTNLGALIDEIEYKILLIDSEDYLFPLSGKRGPPNSLLNLLKYQPMKSEEDFSNLVSRYNSFPQQVEEIITLMRYGVKKGMVQHEVSLKSFKEQIVSLTSKNTAESTFFNPFLMFILDVVPEEEREKHVTAVTKSIADKLYPGLQALSEFIQNEYLQRTRHNFAVSSLPHENYYNIMLNYYTTDHVTPQMIYDLGAQEVKRILKEINILIHDLGFDSSPQEYYHNLYGNSSSYFKTQDEVLPTIVDIIRNGIEPQLPRIFKKLPKAKLTIEETSVGYEYFRYTPPSINGASDGILFLNTEALLRYPNDMTVALALHAAEPGQHLQVAYVLEQKDLPRFRKQRFPPLYDAYFEGWRYYSEFLGNEMELYGDKYMSLGHLGGELYRAHSLVLETGLHAFNWSRHQAKEYLLTQTGVRSHFIDDIIDTHITEPALASTQKYGEIKIREFRQKAEKLLGDKFDIKEFHDVVLSNPGSIGFLQKQVDGYITSATCA